MKVIIAGSRHINDFAMVNNIISSSGIHITELISGGCHGVDKLGEIYANLKSIPIRIFPADWGKYGRRAGPLRNKQMADYADALIAIWDGKSAGTKNMIMEALKNKLEVHIKYVG